MCQADAVQPACNPFLLLYCSMLYRIHDSTWFFIGSVFCRGFQSVGVTMSSVTYYGIAAANFPDKMTVFIVSVYFIAIGVDL